MFDGFGEVRSALHGAPSKARWWELCGVLDRMGGAHLAGRVLPYVSASLARWPDDLRVAPDNWIDRLMYAGRCDLVTLTRRLSFEGRWVPPDMLEVLLGSPSTRALSYVHLGSSVPDAEVMQAVVGSEAVRSGALRGLGFSRIKVHEDTFAVLLDAGVEWRELAFHDVSMARRVVELMDRGAPNLERLALPDCRLDEDAAMALANMSDLGGLRTLNLAGNRAAGFARRFVATAHSLGRFERLTSLDLSHTELDASDARPLVALVERLPLERVTLDGTAGMDELLRRLAMSEALGRLKHVGVDGAVEDPGSFAWLIDAPGASDALRASALDQLYRMTAEPELGDATYDDQVELPF